jgi:hypothetical protein
MRDIQRRLFLNSDEDADAIHAALAD